MQGRDEGWDGGGGNDEEVDNKRDFKEDGGWMVATQWQRWMLWGTWDEGVKEEEEKEEIIFGWHEPLNRIVVKQKVAFVCDRPLKQL